MKTLKFSIAALSLLTLAACSLESPPPSAQQTEQRKAQQQQAQFNKSTPIPVLPISQERENLTKRATRINVQNMSGCVSLYFENGVLQGTYPVAGKISYLRSYLLSGDQIVRDPYSNTYGNTTLVVEQPDIDGAYGENAPAIFFFTADTDAYVEWSSNYFFSDQCILTNSTPLQVEAVSE